MISFEIFLLFFLIVCVIGVIFTKNLLHAIIIYTAFSMVMSIVWIILQSPDVAITEAAAGTGITTVLLYLTLAKVKRMEEDHLNDRE